MAEPKESKLKTAGRVLLGLLVLLALFIVPAGRLDWWPAWVFLALYLALVAVFALWTARRHPGLLSERRRPAGEVKRWDQQLMRVYTVALVALVVVAGLDAGRFGWAPAPLWLQALGWLLMLASAALILWVTRSNPFLSSMARIQDDRGQRVVSDGPYAWLRHPMYLGICLLAPGLALALGSLWALLPAGLVSALMVLRTALEDRMLRQELPGYQDYAQRVRYRLLPGVW